MGLEDFTLNLEGARLTITIKPENSNPPIHLIKAKLDGRDYFARYDCDKGMFIDDIFGEAHLLGKTVAEEDELRRNAVETYKGLIKQGVIELPF